MYFYSNTAPELMAYILEQAYEKPYTNLIDELFTSMNMPNTTFRLDEKQAMALVKGYNGDGTLMPNLHSSLWGGSVGIHSTSQDMLQFIKHQLSDTVDIVNESHKELFTINEEHSVGYFWHIVEQEGVVSYRNHGGIYGMQNWLILLWTRYRDFSYY